MLQFHVENLTAFFSNEGLSFRGDCNVVSFYPPGFTRSIEKIKTIRNASWHFWIKSGKEKSMAHLSYFESMQCCEVQFFLASDQFDRFASFLDKKIIHKDLRLTANVSEAIGWNSQSNQFESVEKTNFEEFLEGRNLLSDSFWFELE